MILNLETIYKIEAVRLALNDWIAEPLGDEEKYRGSAEEILDEIDTQFSFILTQL